MCLNIDLPRDEIQTVSGLNFDIPHLLTGLSYSYCASCSDVNMSVVMKRYLPWICCHSDQKLLSFWDCHDATHFSDIKDFPCYQ